MKGMELENSTPWFLVPGVELFLLTEYYIQELIGIICKK